MHTYKEKSFLIKTLSILIAFYPVSFILGNLIINLNTLFIIIIGISVFKLDIFKIDTRILRYLIPFFFFTVIFSTILNYLNNLNNITEINLYKDNVIKSFLYLRYFLLFLVVNKLTSLNLLEIKYLFYVSGALCFFLGLDLIVQNIHGKDLFGLVSPHERKLSGFFGDEIIAGGYLQNFSFFAILCFPLIFKNYNKKQFFLYLIISIMFFLGCIMISGNRVPLFLFVGSVIVLFLIEKELRKKFAIFILIFTLFAGSIYAYDSKVKNNVNNLFFWSNEILTNSYKVLNFNINYESRSFHLRNFKYGIHVWQQNKWLGSGLRSLRQNCKNELRFMQKAGFILCNNHPHNYYIEILADTGLVGFISVMVLFLFSLINFFIFYLKNSNLKIEKKIAYLAPFLIFCAQIFPIKSSGSFFSTSNATLIFLVFALVSNANFYKKKI